MSAFVFDPTKSYAQVCYVVGPAEAEVAKRSLMEAAREVVPEEWRKHIILSSRPIDDRDIDAPELEDNGWIAYWKYCPPFVILNDDWPVRIEVEP